LKILRKRSGDSQRFEERVSPEFNSQDEWWWK
jgi:hypothetical protein